MGIEMEYQKFLSEGETSRRGHQEDFHGCGGRPESTETNEEVVSLAILV